MFGIDYNNDRKSFNINFNNNKAFKISFVNNNIDSSINIFDNIMTFTMGHTNVNIFNDRTSIEIVLSNFSQILDDIKVSFDNVLDISQKDNEYILKTDKNIFKLSTENTNVNIIDNSIIEFTSSNEEMHFSISQYDEQFNIMSVNSSSYLTTPEFKIRLYDDPLYTKQRPTYKGMQVISSVPNSPQKPSDNDTSGFYYYCENGVRQPNLIVYVLIESNVSISLNDITNLSIYKVGSDEPVKTLVLTTDNPSNNKFYTSFNVNDFKDDKLLLFDVKLTVSTRNSIPIKFAVSSNPDTYKTNDQQLFNIFNIS
jgi:hypothetical protein